MAQKEVSVGTGIEGNKQVIFQPKPSFSPVSRQQLSTPNTLSMIATGINIEQIRDILNSRMEFKIELRASEQKDIMEMFKFHDEMYIYG